MISSYIDTVRLLNRDVRLVFATYAVFGFAWGGLYTLLFNLYLLRLGYDTDFIGVVNGVSRFAFALGGLPAGMLGMRFGARRMILLGVSVIATGLVALPLGEFVPVDWRAGWIIVTLSGAFAGGSLFFVNMTPYLMTVVTEEERAHVFSFNSVLLPACGVLGSLIGGLLPGLVADFLGSTVEDPAAYRWPLLLAGTLFWLCLPPLLATQRTESTVSTSQTDDSGPPIGLLLVLSAVLFLVNAPRCGDGLLQRVPRHRVIRVDGNDLARHLSRFLGVALEMGALGMMGDEPISVADELIAAGQQEHIRSITGNFFDKQIPTRSYPVALQ